LSFAELIWRNITSRSVRSLLTAAAVAIGITTVVALGVLTHSLKVTATSVLKTGSADFTVAQEGVSDVLYSAMDEEEVSRIASDPGVDKVVGVLIGVAQLDKDHPFFLRLGLPPGQLADFGVDVVDGRPYSADAPDEIILGYRAARDLGKKVGDDFTVENDSYRVVGIFRTGQVFGDSASMLSLSQLQAEERKPGDVTLAFVRVKEGQDVDAVRKRIEQANPELATVRTESEFGRVDRNLELIKAANTGATILALVIGAVGVSNTMMMSVFERTREFGVLRAVGWSRLRVLFMVLNEGFLLSFIGAAAGCLAGYLVVQALQDVPALRGVFNPTWEAGVFGRALALAFGMALVGALYPAVRAARLAPIAALRHE